MGMKGFVTGMLVLVKHRRRRSKAHSTGHMKDSERSCAMALDHKLHCMRSERSGSYHHCFLQTIDEGFVALG